MVRHDGLHYLVFDCQLQEPLETHYEFESTASVARDALEEGRMTPTRASYSREAWARAQKLTHTPSPVEVAEQVASAMHDRSIWDRLLTDAVPWLG